MINNSFLLPAGQLWLKDGQAIVATTEDEGLWVSFDYGETWANINPGYELISAIMPRTGMRIDNNLSTIDTYPAIIAATLDGKVFKYRFSDAGIEILDIATQLHRLKADIALFDRTNVVIRRDYDYMPPSKTQYDAYMHNFGALINDCLIASGNAYVALNSGYLMTGNSYANNDYSIIDFGGYTPAKLAMAGKLYVFTASSVWFIHEGEWMEVNLAPDLSIPVGYGGYDRVGNACAGGDSVAIAVPDILLRSSNQGFTWNKYFEGEGVRGVSMSNNGAMQVAAIYNQPLKKWNENTGNFIDLLPAKKYTGVYVYRSLLDSGTKLKKPE